MKQIVYTEHEDCVLTTAYTQAMSNGHRVFFGDIRRYEGEEVIVCRTRDQYTVISLFKRLSEIIVQRDVSIYVITRQTLWEIIVSLQWKSMRWLVEEIAKNYWCNDPTLKVVRLLYDMIVNFYQECTTSYFIYGENNALMDRIIKEYSKKIWHPILELKVNETTDLLNVIRYRVDDSVLLERLLKRLYYYETHICDMEEYEIPICERILEQGKAFVETVHDVKEIISRLSKKENEDVVVVSEPKYKIIDLSEY